MQPHPPILNQRRLNSCSAQAIAAAIWFDELRVRPPVAKAPSALFIYYNERAKEGLLFCNRPVALRDGYKSVSKMGVCCEELWPYHPGKYDRKPTPRCFREARKLRVTEFQRVRRELRDLKACLAEGFPFAFGGTYFDSFKSRRVARTGVVPMPKRGEHQLGGHAMLAIGYNDQQGVFIVQNSFGPRWGAQGYCFLPFDYLMNPNLAWDFWTARKLARR
jgi:C1A family cysteine protease